jgi:alkylated DNA nucleotide flippase Atl1
MPAAKKRHSWRQKLARDEGFPKVVPIGPSMRSQWGEGTMVIPAPREVDEIMKRVPKGKVITINEIRAILARRHGATIACPMTTGIFAWIAANAAEESVPGYPNLATTPYWRTLKTGGYLNEKYPGGVPAQKARLEAEGHRVEERGKRLVVAEYELALALDEAED